MAWLSVYVAQNTRSMNFATILKRCTPGLTARSCQRNILLAHIVFLYGCASSPPRPELGHEKARPAAAREVLAELSTRFEALHGGEASG